MIYLEEELYLRQRVLELVKEFHKELLDNMIGDYAIVPLTPYNELSCRLWKNLDRIKEYNGLGGYVILDDDTIICVTSSQYIWQFDGCKWWEIN